MSAQRGGRRAGRCQTCGEAAARHGLPLCLGCHVAEQRAGGYAEGFQLGLAEGEVRTWSRLAAAGRLRPDPAAHRGGPDVPLGYVQVCVSNWRRVAGLIHPDRHNGSEAATAAAAWWNSLRDRVAP